MTRRRASLPFLAPPPPDRGPLLTAEQVAELLGGAVTPAWVRRTVPGKLSLGQRTIRWHRDDVLQWIASRQVGRPTE